MIGKLKGLLDSVGDDTIIIDVGGVGYEVHCSTRTLIGLPGVGEPLSLAIETHVRETEIKLYGFGDDLERDWFVCCKASRELEPKWRWPSSQPCQPESLLRPSPCRTRQWWLERLVLGPRWHNALCLN